MIAASSLPIINYNVIFTTVGVKKGTAFIKKSRTFPII